VESKTELKVPVRTMAPMEAMDPMHPSN
jgi:hypothetical protein